MSDDNVFDLFGDPNDEPEDENWAGFNPDDEDAPDASEVADPGMVAFMDQEAASFNAMEHEFADRYGFVHKCRCDADYASGNMVSVTECYANMTTDALDACAALYAENKLLRALIGKAFNGTAQSGMGVEESDPNVWGDDTDDDGADPADGFA